MARIRARDRFESTYRQSTPKLLQTTVEACDRLADPTDGDALHDFRVAARRLRTHLEAHRDHLGKERCKRVRKALTHIVGGTNAGRDFEVHREWLQEQLNRNGLPALQREGLEWMLAERYSDEDPELRHATSAVIRREFAEIRDELTTEDWVPTTGMAEHAMTAAAYEAICDNLGKLKGQLSRIESVDNVKATHRARLAVKRLRYLLEPLLHEVPGARRAIAEMKQIQDVLGDLRDLQILETHIIGEVGRAANRWSDQLVRTGAHDPRVAAITRGTPESRACYALAAGMQRVRREEQRQFERARKRWLKGNTEKFIAHLEKVAGRLRSSPGKTRKATIPAGKPGKKTPAR